MTFLLTLMIFPHLPAHQLFPANVAAGGHVFEARRSTDADLVEAFLPARAAIDLVHVELASTTVA
jgi:hypothetical protein